MLNQVKNPTFWLFQSYQAIPNHSTRPGKHTKCFWSHGPVEIVDLPIATWIFHSCVNVYQRVIHSQFQFWVKTPHHQPPTAAGSITCHGNALLLSSQRCSPRGFCPVDPRSFSVQDISMDVGCYTKLVGGLEHVFFSPFSLEFHNPNWLMLQIYIYTFKYVHTHLQDLYVHANTHAHTHTPIILPSWNSQKQTTTLHSDGQLACFVGKSAIYQPISGHFP